MPRTFPPKGFESSEIELFTLPARSKWLRLCWSGHPDPLGFGFSPSRFSDPRLHLPESERFAVIYFGSSLKVCFLERVLRDRRNGKLGDIPIPYAELEELNCVEVETAEALKLVDLRNDCPVRMGVPTNAVRASSHRLGQRCSLAFHDHDERPEGILYPSRLNEEINLALYHTVLPKVTITGVRPLLECRTELAALIRHFKIAII